VTLRRTLWFTVAGIVVAVMSVGAIGAVALRHMSFEQQSKEEFDRLVQRQEEAQVVSGVLVEEVPLLTAANRIGLRGGDIIIKYNEEPVTDFRTYRAVLDRFAAGGVRSVTLTVMRAGAPVEITAPAGLLGFDARSWEWVTHRTFKLVRADRTEDAISMLATIGPSEVSEAGYLKSKIVILDDNDAQDELRNALLSRLLPLVAPDEFCCLGTSFLNAGRTKAAEVFLTKAIEADPADITARVNLAIAYTRLKKYDDAARLMDDIVANHSRELGDLGWHDLLQNRGEVYLSRHNDAAAATDFRKAIELDVDPDDDDTNLLNLYLLSLARLKDLDRFEEGVALCTKHATKGYSSRPYDRDGLRAYALLANGNEDGARAAVQKWRNDANAQKWFKNYWGRDFPGASDVMDVWNRLTKLTQ
jgi:predicted negative regulator of RcsB-dependent stress response